ncbi:MAG TPA: blue light sensor protein, partial [Flavobacteriales bacterium]|nr:blue light sensor protein [Flavobacteriales bacterium]
MADTSNFFQLTYYSAAVEDLDADEVISILQKSRVNNAANDITGCLLYHNSEFLQILEGKEESVRNLFKKIQQDKRHEAVLQLAENTTSKRLFGQWSMA